MSVEADRVVKGITALLSLVSSAVLASVYLLLSAWVSPAMTAIVVLGGIITGPFLVPSVRSARGSGTRLTELTRRLYRSVLDHLAGIREVKSMGAEARHAVELQAMTDAVSRTRLDFEAAKGRALFMFSVGTVTAVSSVTYVAIEVLKVPAVDLVMLVLICSRITPRLLKMQNDFQDLIHSLPAYEAMTQLRWQCESAAENTDVESETASPFTPVGRIQLANVGFRYAANAELWAVRHLDLAIEPRTITAIVGHSGSGKSTLADLLLGLLRPAEGSITANGVNIGDNAAAWRRKIGYVPQETFLFNDSLRSNLLLGHPFATENEIAQVLQSASIDDVVKNLPDGLNTFVGERGSRLSGGERQRIALARALLRRPQVLILDEATSALDPANQERIRASLRRLAESMTIIIITHQKSVIRDVDQVVVLDRGRILRIDRATNAA
ncbi:MAG: ABC transporter ATP-binding protein [Planctomycetaceae bacterium]|nr:ABC transporter ATP-binding protein [Planctomycetaceae bacterium]